MGEKILPDRPEDTDKKPGWRRIGAEKPKVQPEPDEDQLISPSQESSEVKSPDSSWSAGWRRASERQVETEIDEKTGIPRPFAELADLTVLNRDENMTLREKEGSESTASHPEEDWLSSEEETRYLRFLSEKLDGLRGANFSKEHFIGDPISSLWLTPPKTRNESILQAWVKAREELKQNGIRFYYLPRGTDLKVYVRGSEENRNHFAKYGYVIDNIPPQSSDKALTAAHTSTEGILKNGEVVKQSEIAIYGEHPKGSQR